MSTFKEMGLKSEILSAIEELGYENPTKIQSLALPKILESKQDLIAFAQTGTGKTAAFSLPVLNQIDTSKKGIKCIVLSPTRELGLQIAEDIKSYSKNMSGFKVVAVYGGADIQNQIRKIERGCDIVVGTPGRTLDLIKRNRLNLEGVEYLVLDEADEMLSMGFAEDLDAILANTPADKQTLLFSATMPPDMVKLSKKYMNDPAEITAGSKQEANTNVTHVYYKINSRDRYPALKRAVDIAPDIYGIIFCRTRAETKEVAERLAEDGYNTDALHGDLSQAQRDYVMGKFRNRQLQLLVATDVAARGLDVNELTHVINFKLPDEDAVYVHRSGRTGRAGNEGFSLSLLTGNEERRLRYLEKKIGRKFERIDIPNGQEICEKQLFNLIDNIKETEIANSHIDSFLPQIFEKFEDMTKEEVIKKIVSTEFNRFLEYYRDAPDLNKTSDRRERERNRDRDNDRGDRRERRRDRGERQEHVTAAHMTRYFINQGKKDGFSPKLLMGMINSHLGGASPEIGQIEIMKMFSFFEMESGHTADLQRAAKQMEHNGREVSIEESSPKPSGGGGRNRGGDRNRGGGDRRDRRDGRRDSRRSGGGRDHRGGGGRRESTGSHGAKRRRRY
ncbi:MAG: DEAD/DEAH box helicase [Bacteroidia bacterium]